MSKALVRTRVARKLATAKGLRYVAVSSQGIFRKRLGKNFSYADAAGKKIVDAATLERIRKLAIPPAYENVWICAQPHGHLQAIGIDARGRKQYRYHADWRAIRDSDKFKRMQQFGKLLPKLRARLRRDLRLPGLPLQKVLALAVSLLQATLVRIGNTEYAKQNNSFGLTTLRNRHVQFSGASKITLQFRGKSGKTQNIELSDKRLARILHRCQELPGQHLFQYIDEAGQHQPIDSGMVNDYLVEIMGLANDGTGFTAKDFRTWGATLHAIRLLTDMPCPPTKTAQTRAILEVCNEVAAELGNTPTICRKSYINPWVFTAWSLGLKPRQDATGKSVNAQERYALQLLKLQNRHPAAESLH